MFSWLRSASGQGRVHICPAAALPLLLGGSAREKLGINARFGLGDTRTDIDREQTVSTLPFTAISLLTTYFSRLYSYQLYDK